MNEQFCPMTILLPLQFFVNIERYSNQEGSTKCSAARIFTVETHPGVRAF